MSEWFKEHAWKACVRVTVPEVRILSLPPFLFHKNDYSDVSKGGKLCHLKNSKDEIVSKFIVRY